MTARGVVNGGCVLLSVVDVASDTAAVGNHDYYWRRDGQVRRWVDAEVLAVEVKRRRLW